MPDLAGLHVNGIVRRTRTRNSRVSGSSLNKVKLIELIARHNARSTARTRGTSVHSLRPAGRLGRQFRGSRRNCDARTGVTRLVGSPHRCVWLLHSGVWESGPVLHSRRGVSKRSIGNCSSGTGGTHESSQESNSRSGRRSRTGGRHGREARASGVAATDCQWASGSRRAGNYRELHMEGFGSRFTRPSAHITGSRGRT